MYNTTFKVKYHDIQLELSAKLESANTEAGSEHQVSYTTEDIQIVCDKLYRDELTSVFNADDILDDKIDEGMKHVLTKMMENERVCTWIGQLKTELSQTYDLNEEITDQPVDISIFVLLILFSKYLFYLTHKCICQQFTENKIDDHLLNEWMLAVETFRTTSQS